MGNSNVASALAKNSIGLNYLHAWMSRQAGIPTAKIAQELSISPESVTDYVAIANKMLQRNTTNRRIVMQWQEALAPYAIKSVMRLLAKDNPMIVKAYMEGMGYWRQNIDITNTVISAQLPDLIAALKGDQSQEVRDMLKDVDYTVLEDIPDNKDQVGNVSRETNDISASDVISNVQDTQDNALKQCNQDIKNPDSYDECRDANQDTVDIDDGSEVGGLESMPKQGNNDLISVDSCANDRVGYQQDIDVISKQGIISPDSGVMGDAQDVEGSASDAEGLGDTTTNTGIVPVLSPEISNSEPNSGLPESSKGRVASPKPTRKPRPRRLKKRRGWKPPLEETW